MLAIVDVTAPFSAPILCGGLVARLRLLPDNSLLALNTFVLYGALSCTLFRLSAGARGSRTSPARRRAAHA